MEENLFIKLDIVDEINIKKNLLKLQEGIIISQASLEEIKDLKKEKITLMKIIKERVRKIRELWRNLEEILPKEKEKKKKIKEKKEKKVVKKAKAKKEIKKTKKISKNKSKKLELREELEAIRQKLSMLG